MHGHEEKILEERMARLNAGIAQRTYVTWALVALNAVMLVVLAGAGRSPPGRRRGSA